MQQQQNDLRKKTSTEVDFFTEYGEANRFKILEVIGKGSYGVVCSAVDTLTGEKVAIKKINDIFEHVSDATRILREIKLLRLLRHPDIVEIKHIMLPPSRREFKDIYVVFELMESDLHQVIKVNDDLTPEHYRFFLYQLLRALKYIHTGENFLSTFNKEDSCNEVMLGVFDKDRLYFSKLIDDFQGFFPFHIKFVYIVRANVFHRDLKPKNVLANADCKLKICDFGLARVAFSDTPTAIFWTDYVATRWYRAPELCGSFFSKYTPAIDIWSIGCIFAEILTGKPLFPGKNVVHQLDLITDLLGTPSPEAIARVRNEKARRYLSSMRKKKPIPFSRKFPNADPLALKLLERLLAFEPNDRPTAEEALADPYFHGLANVDREPSARTISKLEFEFERRRVTKEDVRELIYREILEYHPQMLKEHLEGADSTNFMYPSAVEQFKKQFAYLEEHYGKGGSVAPLGRQHASLPRPSVLHSDNVILPCEQKCQSKEPASEARDSSKASRFVKEVDNQQDKISSSTMNGPLQASQRLIQGGHAKPGKVVGSVVPPESCVNTDTGESRKFSVLSSEYDSSIYCYPWRNSAAKIQEDEKPEDQSGGSEARKMTAPQVGGARWS